MKMYNNEQILMKGRMTKNTSKSRRHERRELDPRQVRNFERETNKKMRQNTKNFKRWEQANLLAYYNTDC